MTATLDLEIQIGTTFGPVEILCKDAAGVPVPLAGWSARAQARHTPDATLIVDLLPVIEADDTAGLITLSEIPWATTAAMNEGEFSWDLVLVDPDGRRLPPFLGGRLKVSKILTQDITP